MQDNRSYREENAPKSGALVRWVGILSSLFVVGFIAYWAFNLGRRDASEVPVIAALEGEARTAPEEGAEASGDYEGLAVNDVLEGQSPETGGSSNLAPTPADVSSVEPAQETGAPGESLASQDGALEDDGKEALTSGIGSDVVVATPPKRPELLFVPSVSPEPAVEAEAEPTIEDQIAQLQSETVNESETPAEPDPTPPPAPKPTAQTASLPAGTPLIQLAANVTEDATRQQWAQLQADNQDVLGDKSLYVEQAIVNGQNFYRLRVQGFANSDQTRAACATLMARNIQCLAVTAQ